MRNKLWVLLILFCLGTPCLAQDIIAPDTLPITGEPIHDQGISFQSIWRGILGMASLIFIAYMFSNNRKAIKWKTVGIGLLLQLLIAIGVLKVPFIQSLFESIGQVFVSVLDYT